MPKKTKSPVSKQTIKRPPVVVVLGHVDHGKTTLLDTIRKTQVVKTESGGITQHVGAYQVQVDPKNPQATLTFIDTPGHEAFSEMRSRGAKVADIAVLVVAANDGVKPQTKEAIKHIKESGVPFLVAINKIDLPDINLDVTKAQLAEQGVLVEGYGGDIVTVPVSALQHKGIDNLLEMINLLYELQEIEVQTNELKAVVLESFIDKRKGIVANLLVRSGTVKQGDIVYCQGQQAKIRSLMSDTGAMITQAGASQPVQMLGFKHVLPIGEIVTHTPQVEKSKEITTKPASDVDEEKPRLKLLIKADVAGTLEAIKANLTEEVDLVGSGVGDVTESDVLLAESTKARLIAFRVQVHKDIKRLADLELVKIEQFQVIYHLLEDIQARVLKLIEPTINEQELGKGEIVAEFNIKGTHIAGCKLLEGRFHKADQFRIFRKEQVIGTVRLQAMQVNKIETKEVDKGEVALVFKPDINFKLGDTIVAFRTVDD